MQTTRKLQNRNVSYLYLSIGFMESQPKRIWCQTRAGETKPIKTARVARTTSITKNAPAKIAALKKNIGKSIAIIPYDMKKLTIR